MFQEGSNDILDETKPCWSGYEQIGMKKKNGKDYQEDFLIPGMTPSLANSRKQMRHRSKSLM